MTTAVLLPMPLPGYTAPDNERVYQLIQQHPGISYHRLARMTGMSAGAVYNIVTSLTYDRWMYEDGRGGLYATAD